MLLMYSILLKVIIDQNGHTTTLGCRESWESDLASSASIAEATKKEHLEMGMYVI